MRNAEISRKTKETDITVSLCLEGGAVKASTGVGFFDHMLTALAQHAGFGLNVTCKGDLQVDCHHTVEDIGIVLGTALRSALGDNPCIERYGTFFVPMDESLAMASLDICNRPFFVCDASYPQEKTGDFDCCMCNEFFRALAFNAGITLHIKSLYGDNSHHIIEAIFKAVGHALKIAVVETNSVLSTKGTL